MRKDPGLSLILLSHFLCLCISGHLEHLLFFAHYVLLPWECKYVGPKLRSLAYTGVAQAWDTTVGGCVLLSCWGELELLFILPNDGDRTECLHQVTCIPSAEGFHLFCQRHFSRLAQEGDLGILLTEVYGSSWPFHPLSNPAASYPQTSLGLPFLHSSSICKDHCVFIEPSK